MVRFSTQGRVVSDMLGSKNVNTRTYSIFNVEIGDLVVSAIFDTTNSEPPVNGTCFESQSCWVSNLASEEENSIGIVIPNYTVIPEEDFKPLANAVVRINGRIYKREDCLKPKRVGINHSLCMTVKLRAKNEIDEMYNITVVGLGKSAHIVEGLEDRGFYNVVGTLKRRTDKHNNYKIYVDSVEVVGK